jgi:hypothetical protein
MRNSETMWEFRTARFTVAWEISPCDDLDLSWDDTGETRANLESGLWCAFDSAVVVYMDGREIGADYLGQSIYENPSEFRLEHLGGKFGSYFSDMVRGAIAEARATLAREAATAPRLRTLANA